MLARTKHFANCSGITALPTLTFARFLTISLCPAHLLTRSPPNPHAMAGFKTHITTSSILGVGYGAGAYTMYHLPLPTCILAGGLCGVSGMLPDLDSGPGRPLRESMAFAAAVVPMMMVDRFKAMNMSLETIILIGGAMYLAIRFGMAAILRRYTVHRGMFHSSAGRRNFWRSRIFSVRQREHQSARISSLARWSLASCRI